MYWETLMTSIMMFGNKKRDTLVRSIQVHGLSFVTLLMDACSGNKQTHCKLLRNTFVTSRHFYRRVW